MPLNRPAEPLAPGPRGAVEARRWVVEVCTEIGREDLVENAELAMSEVVTNAILHGRPPVTVRLRGTRTHPRVEVRDASPEPPALPHAEAEQGFLDDSELVTFGRGLTIVASSSVAWGAERDGEGKLVWFEPSATAPPTPALGVFLGWDDEPDEVASYAAHTQVVHLLHVPTEALQAMLAHGAELRRELRLLAVAHEDTYPVASDLSAFFSTLAGEFRWQLSGDALLDALQRGRTHIDLDIKAAPDAGERFARLTELYELADAFCRNERLLTLARTPALAEFETWLFQEFVRQARGEDPVPWDDGNGHGERSFAHP